MDNNGNAKTKIQACSVWDGVKVKAVKECYRRYLITSAEELMWVAKVVNSGKRNFSGKTILLRCDIDLDNHPWLPIGISKSCPFCGEFDGGGHTIRGVNIRGDLEYIGFFGCVTGNGESRPAVICDVQLLELKVVGTGLFSCSGGLAGCVAQHVEVSNCVVIGKVGSTNCAGGLIGLAEEQVRVTNCMVSGVISGVHGTGGVVCHLLKESSVSGCSVTEDTVREECAAQMVSETDGDSTVSGSDSYIRC